MERLIELFGHENCVHIMTNIPPPSHLNGQDMLLFDPSPSGQYSVKRVYNEINEKWRAVPNNCPELWQGIWKKGDIQPRVRLFLWKLISGKLPLAQSIASRIGAVSSTCVICSQGEEDAMHTVSMPICKSMLDELGFPFQNRSATGKSQASFAIGADNWYGGTMVRACLNCLGNMEMSKCKSISRPTAFFSAILKFPIDNQSREQIGK